MSVTAITVALGLVILAVTIWMIRQHREASRNVPVVAGPVGVVVPAVCILIALSIVAAPIGRRGLPMAADVLGYTAAATQTATALLPATTPTPTAAPPPPAVVPTPEFAPYWVRNHRRTQMWSGRAGPPGIVSFGVTSGQFCIFEVVRQQDNSRLYVLNPYDTNYFWIDANDSGQNRICRSIDPARNLRASTAPTRSTTTSAGRSGAPGLQLPDSDQPVASPPGRDYGSARTLSVAARIGGRPAAGAISDAPSASRPNRSS